MGDSCTLMLSFCLRGGGLVIRGKRENWGEEMIHVSLAERSMCFFLQRFSYWNILYKMGDHKKVVNFKSSLGSHLSAKV